MHAKVPYLRHEFTNFIETFIVGICFEISFESKYCAHHTSESGTNCSPSEFAQARYHHHALFENVSVLLHFNFATFSFFEVDSESQDFVEDASEFHHPLEQQASSFNDIEEGTLPASILNRENAGEDFDEIQEDWKD